MSIFTLDTLPYILSFLNIETLSTYSLINSTFNYVLKSKSFWRQKIYRDYPSLSSLQYIVSESYTKHHYIELLSIYSVTYGSQLFKSVNMCLIRCIREQRLNIIPYFLHLGANNFNSAFCHSIKICSADLCHLFLPHVTCFNKCLKTIEQFSRHDMLYLIPSKYHPTYIPQNCKISHLDYGLYGACLAGSLSRVKYYLSLNYTYDIQSLFLYAGRSNNFDIVHHLIQHYSNDTFLDRHYTLLGAVRRGNPEFIHLISTTYGLCLEDAICSFGYHHNHTPFLSFLSCANPFQLFCYIDTLIRQGHRHLLELFIFNNYENDIPIIFTAAEKGHLDICIFLLSPPISKFSLFTRLFTRCYLWS